MRICYFLIPFFSLVLISFTDLYAQNISTEGKEFWLGFMENHETHPIELEIFISSNDTTTGIVEMPYYNWSASFTSYPGTTAKVTVPTSYAMNKGSGSVTNRGIHVVAENTVSVYALNKRTYSSDATVVLPSISLGREYYAMAHMEPDGGGPSRFSEILIVAIADQTEIQITPSVGTVNGHTAGVPFEIEMNEGQSYQLQSNYDLTGTLIETVNAAQSDCKSFAVFGGNEWTRIGQCGGAQDNLFEQMYPVNTWGREFVSVPYKTRVGGDILKILASEDSTEVVINNGTPKIINAGKYMSLLISDEAYIKSDKPISIGQFSRSQSCDRVEADPFFIMLSPIEQRLKTVTFNALEIHVVDRYYLNVVVPTEGVERTFLDGDNISSFFTPVPQNETFSYAQIDIEEGNHTLQCDDGFIATIYGYGNIESFGYATGVSLQNLNLIIKSAEPGSDFTTRKDSTCIDDPVEFSVDADSSFTYFDWDFADGNVASGKNVFHSFSNTGIYPVKVTANTAQGACSSQETSIKYINVVKPKIDIYGPRSVCPNVAQIEYKAIGDSRNTYEWFVEGGMITTDSYSNNILVDWGPTSDIAYIKLLPRNYLGCYGDTLKLKVKINIRLEPSTPFGVDSLCSDLAFNIEYEAYLANGSSYDWHIDNGEIIDGQGSNIAQVSWSDPGMGKLWFEESSDLDDICSGWSDTLTVFIERAPDEEISIEIDDKVHYNDDSVLIHVDADPAFQYYSWSFGDGAAIDSIPRNDDTLHIYQCNNQYLITINAYTNTVCQNIGEGAKLLEIHAPELEMISVSNDTTNNIDLRIDWEYTGSNNYQQSIYLWRQQIFPEVMTWGQLGTFTFDESEFLDLTRPSDSTIYLYKVETNNNCDQPIQSNEHNNILITTLENESDSSTLVNWNDYINWDQGVLNYEIWRRTDNEEFMLLATPTDTEVIYPYEYDGFDFCYKVKAIENGGNNAFSWSNTSCVEFVPTIKTYNFFSPNEDEHNQNLVIERIELYKNSQLEIYNRYGKKITEFRNYQNDWDGRIGGNLLPSGIYYYVLRLNEPRNHRDLIKGHFTLSY